MSLNGKGHFWVLTGASIQVWNALDGTKSQEEIAAKNLLSKFMTASQWNRKTMKLLADLHKAKLIVNAHRKNSSKANSRTNLKSGLRSKKV